MSDRDAAIEPGERAAEVLERLRAGVRQRQAELACLDEQLGDRPAPLAAVRRDAVLDEPTLRVEGAGALRTFLERASYALLGRRQHRSLIAQQNRFNRSAELALEELYRRQEALANDLRRLERQLEKPESPRAERS